MKYYIIGIKGSGTSTLACLLHDLGNEVVGYDDKEGYKFTMEGLLKRNISIYHGDDYPVLDKDTIVTYTAAINMEHHELKRVSDLGYRIIAYKDLMASLTNEFESICVCGTHGKTTTSLMISEMFKKTLGCSCFVGDGTGYGDKNSKYLVMESCEYNKHFLAYHPFNTVITNIELDHTETYPNIDKMIEAFQEFVDKTKNKVILCGDDKNSLRLKVDKGYYYGFDEKNDLVIKNKEVLNGKTSFDLFYHGNFYNHFEVNMFGNHLILDAAASVLVSILYDLDKEVVKDVLEKFVPAKRRFNETVIGNNVIIDDYAHHPTEIKVTYDSAYQKYPDKKIKAIFLPNTYSRTEALFDDFVEALKLYDKAYLMEISCDRERKEDYPNISSSKLVQEIPNSEMIDIDSVDKLLEEDNVVLCFMSCAFISPMIEKTKDLLIKNIQ